MSRILIACTCMVCLTLAWGGGVAVADAGDAPEPPANVSVESDHDRSHDHNDDSAVHDQSGGGGFTLERLAHWLGNFHPAAVHFPIALLLAAFLAELISILTGSQRYASAGRYCLVLGALSAVLAGTLGWFMGGFQWTDGDWIMMTRHRWAGTFTALLSIFLLILCPLSARPDAKVSKRLYRMTLFVAAALVGITGFLGGVLVWGADHMAW